MYLFSDDLILTKYKNASDILLDFYDLRLEFYERRKEYLVKLLTNELLLLNSKIRFIDEYINGVLDINRKNKDYIVSLLEERNYPKLKSDIGALNPTLRFSSIITSGTIPFIASLRIALAFNSASVGANSKLLHPLPVQTRARLHVVSSPAL